MKLEQHTPGERAARSLHRVKQENEAMKGKKRREEKAKSNWEEADTNRRGIVRSSRL